MQLLNVILYNNSEALGSWYLRLLIRKSSCFKPWRRMPLEISVLNQNNKRLSRLAIISKHVAADKRKRFGNVWAVFCGGEFSSSFAGSFFYISVYFFWMQPFLCTLCILSLQDCLLWESAMLCWFRCVFSFFVLLLMVDARWEEPMAWWAPNVWVSLNDAYCFWQVMRLLWLKRLERIWLMRAVLFNWIQGVCGRGAPTQPYCNRT